MAQVCTVPNLCKRVLTASSEACSNLSCPDSMASLSQRGLGHSTMLPCLPSYITHIANSWTLRKLQTPGLFLTEYKQHVWRHLPLKLVIQMSGFLLCLSWAVTRTSRHGWPIYVDWRVLGLWRFHPLGNSPKFVNGRGKGTNRLEEECLECCGAPFLHGSEWNMSTASPSFTPYGNVSQCIGL